MTEISNASPTFTTDNTPTAAKASTSISVSDSALFYGGYLHGGTISFALQDGTNNNVAGYATQTFPVSDGVNSYATAPVTVSLGTGTYHWHVVYRSEERRVGTELSTARREYR